MILSVLLLFFVRSKCPNLARESEQMQGSVKMKNYHPFKGITKGASCSGGEFLPFPC